jgi:hypothetical protein
LRLLASCWPGRFYPIGRRSGNCSKLVLLEVTTYRKSKAT